MAKAGKLLLTGATGFIGRATVRSLQHTGWTVYQCVRSRMESPEEGKIYLDLNNPAGILEIESHHRFDAIVHLGANVGWAGATGEEMFTPNILATGCLALLARKWNARFVYASAAVVCGVKSEVIDSRTPAVVDNDYALSKYLGEQLVEASHVSNCILRIGGVFGLDGPHHLGLNRAIDGVLKGIPPIQVGKGSALRNYVYVHDVSDTIAFALMKGLTGTHLLAGSEVMSVSQMLEALCETLLPGRRPVITPGPEAMSQVIQLSPDLPKPRGFREALVHIKDAVT